MECSSLCRSGHVESEEGRDVIARHGTMWKDMNIGVGTRAADVFVLMFCVRNKTKTSRCARPWLSLFVLDYH